MSQLFHFWKYSQKKYNETDTYTPMFMASQFIPAKVWNQPKMSVR